MSADQPSDPTLEILLQEVRNYTPCISPSESRNSLAGIPAWAVRLAAAKSSQLRWERLALQWYAVEGVSLERRRLLIAARFTPSQAQSKSVSQISDDSLRALAALHRPSQVRSAA